MFFAPQTSFIPVTVALTRYIEAHGFSGNYPYWYLGTTPIKFLTGPIVPSILVGIHKVFPNLSFFDLSYVLLVTCYLLQALGWGLLAASLSEKRIVGWWVGGLMLIAPWNIFWGLSFGEVSAVLATALTPWVLFAYAKISNFKPSSRAQPEGFQISNLVPSLSFALLLLTNTTASVPAMIGLAIVGMVTHKRWETGLKYASLVVISGFILTLWWYSPGFWLTIAGASSFGGRSALGALAWVVDMFRGLVPVILAIAVVLLGIRPKDTFAKFTYAWLGIFGILTLIRFIANPAFWLDWTAWVGEVEVGLILLASYLLARGPVSRFLPASARSYLKSDVGGQENGDLRAVRIPSTTATPRLGYMLLITCYFILGNFIAFQNQHYWLPRSDISQTVEYKIADWFSSNLTIEQFNNSTIFLSGSTAFWLNSLYDVRQVRGGRDEASRDKNWQEAAWEIRQGTDPEESEEWLRSLNIKYLVIHTEDSQEFYHDFENIEKFSQIKSFEKVYEKDGDVIYMMNP